MYAERTNKLKEKIEIYSKIGNCYKSWQRHFDALYYFKKMLHLAWFLKDTQSELKAYDNIGIQYYYLGNMSKAEFYHNRMMKGEIEPKTQEKLICLDYMKKRKLITAYKQVIEFDSFFDQYDKMKGNYLKPFQIPNENEREKNKYFFIIYENKELN